MTDNETKEMAKEAAAEAKKSRIGVIGGGQLGLMLAEALHPMGVDVAALDPAADAPAMQIVERPIVAAYDDREALERMCRECDAVTYEFENVPGEVLIPLVDKYRIPQGYRPLYDSQDRLREKDNARKNGLQTPRYAAADDEESLRRAIGEIGLPCVVKTRTMGYDGHGQAVVRTEADWAKALALVSVPCIVEELVAFDYEASVITVRDAGGDTVCLPVGRNIHREGILDLTIVPAPGMSDGMTRRMQRASAEFMERCGYEGILAIEYFVRGDEFLFNEMAPRPHNSGHWSIEGATESQYTALARYLLKRPLVQPELKGPTIMKNILGEDLEEARRIAAEPREGVHVHLYGKSVSKPKRKMGHITFTGLTYEEYLKRWSDRFVK